MTLKEKIKEYALETGLDIIRIAQAKPLIEHRDLLLSIYNKGINSVDFLENNEDIEKFCNPQLHLKSAKSIIVCAQSYNVNEPDDLSSPGDPHGLIAKYTRRNYYKDTREKLKKLAIFIKGIYPDLQSKIFSNGPVAEKPLANISGIGFYGKNGIIITQKYGSLIVLGEMITNLDLEPDSPLDSNCGECELCIKKCPTGAIIKPYIIDKNRCFQYIGKKDGLLSNEFMEKWGNRFYECQTCQDVCPKNINAKYKNYIPDIGNIGQSVSLISFLSLTESEFREKFKDNKITAKWISFNALRRNAIIALGNSKSPEGIEILNIYAKNENLVLRETAKWSLNKIT